MFAGRLCLFLVPLALLLGSCSNKRLLANENDRLRIRVHELESSNQDLQQRAGELEAQLAAAAVRSEGVSDEVRRSTPQVVAVSLSRLSHARDENGDGALDTLVLYVAPRDGRGRFLQMVGAISINAAVLPADDEARTIGRASFGPEQVREAYRSGMTGAHYAFPLPVEVPPDALKVMVRVVFSDGHTGRELSAERSIDLK